MIDDYVTEKFFTRMKETVVIVLGQANYTKLAPPHSYIHALDYPSPQALAKYLLKMDTDEYLSYFWWQDYYRVRPDGVGHRARLSHFAQAMCRLCEKLHLNDNSPKVYGDMQDWWRNQSHCGATKAPNVTGASPEYTVPFGQVLRGAGA